MTKSLVQQHYEAVQQRRPLAHKCKACQHLTFPMTTACESCGSFAQEQVPLSGQGTLYFASHGTTPPPHPRFAKLAPYVYGHIELDEGPFVQAIITGVPGTPEAVAALFAKLPAKVVVDVIETADLPVLGFRLA